MRKNNQNTLFDLKCSCCNKTLGFITSENKNDSDTYVNWGGKSQTELTLKRRTILENDSFEVEANERGQITIKRKLFLICRDCGTLTLVDFHQGESEKAQVTFVKKHRSNRKRPY